jgi:hypothetical protein
VALLLTAAEIDIIARRGNFYFQVDPQDRFYSDPYLLGGDGTDDLDNLLALIDRTPHIRIMADVGVLSSSFKDVTRDDVVAVKAAYISIYGDVSKPDEYQIPVGVADENPVQP